MSGTEDQGSRGSVDEAARQRIRTSLGESLLVEAAAGTGKTTELVARLVAVIAEGKVPEMGGVVAVTFTRKAAGELKLRLRQELDRARLRLQDEVGGDRRAERIETGIRHLEEAHIGTIHSFCAELLRERPVEAGVDPGFEGLSEDAAPRLFDQAFQAWIQETLQDMPEGVRRVLSRQVVRPPYGAVTPLEQIRRAAWNLCEWRDFPAPWARPEIDLKAESDGLVERVCELAELVRRCEDPRDYLGNSLEPVVALAGWVERFEEVAERDYDELEARLVGLITDIGRSRHRKGRGSFAEGVPRELVISRRDDLLAALEEFRGVADADLAALLQKDVADLLKRYEELKARTGHLDFVDLLIRARDLVRDHTEVRRFFQGSFSHIFVDEFQDTDPLQTELLLLLSSEDAAQSDWRKVRPAAGKLFLVGDPKQSIYRFRRADVVLYQQVKQRLVDAGVGLVHLERSFRSTAPIQAAINQAFAPEMVYDEDKGQAEYIALAPEREALASQPSVVALPVSRPYGWSNITNWQIDESLPEDIVAFVDWALGSSGWMVEDPYDQVLRPLVAGDVCILFRRYVAWRQDVTRPYTRGLEARGIPHVLVGARTFHRREEVETLRSALTAVEWPDDELAVFSTLRGALFSISDELLYVFRHGHRLHPFRWRKDGVDEGDDDANFAPIVEALECLADLHRRRNRRPVVETVQELLEVTRAHAAFALRPAGNQVLANVQRVGDLARSYEIGGGISFRGFVERLSTEAEQPGSSQAPVVEEGAEGVRLMTVHGAKGLEFPMVILADMSCRLSSLNPDRHIDPARGLSALRLLGCAPLELLENSDLERDRDAAEGVRVAYVAATRARDLLVVPAVGDEAREGWLSPLNRAIFPSTENWRQSEHAHGCPIFGQASVLERPQNFDGRPEGSVRPGLHRFPEAGYDVVWWDPQHLQLKVEENFGLRREEILTQDSAGEAERGIERYEAWRELRKNALELGRSKLHDVVTVTELEEGPRQPAAPISQEKVERQPGRPGGRRFGTLVHTLLRDVSLGGVASEIEELATLHGAVLDAPAAEVEAAKSAVTRALAHPVFERARVAEAAGRCFREAPFVLPLADGRLLEGTMDLAFEEDEGWVVVDYKTDADVEERRAGYEIQLAWYLFALARLDAQPSAGVLLAV